MPGILYRILLVLGVEAPPYAFTVDRPGTRREYLRATLSLGAEGPRVSAFPNQSSGVLSSVSRSNALAVVPPGATVAEGDPVEVLLLDLLTG